MDSSSEQDKTMPRGQKKRNIDDFFPNPKRVKTEGTNGTDGWEKSSDGDLLVYQKNLKGSNKVSNFVVFTFCECNDVYNV